MESRVSGTRIVREQKIAVLCGWQAFLVAIVDDPARKALRRRGFALGYMTLAWNMTGIVVLAIVAIAARSVALVGFGLDFLIVAPAGNPQAGSERAAASACVCWHPLDRTAPGSDVAR